MRFGRSAGRPAPAPRERKTGTPGTRREDDEQAERNGCDEEAGTGSFKDRRETRTGTGSFSWRPT